MYTRRGQGGQGSSGLLPKPAPSSANLEDFKAEMRQACQVLNDQYNARHQGAAGVSGGASSSSTDASSLSRSGGRLQPGAQSPATGTRPLGTIATPLPGGLVRRCPAGGSPASAAAAQDAAATAAAQQRVAALGGSTRLPMPPPAPSAGRTAIGGAVQSGAPSHLKPPSADELGPVASPAAAPDGSFTSSRLRKLDRSASAAGSLGKGQVLGGGSSSPSPSSVMRGPEGMRALQKQPAAQPPAGAPPFGRAAPPAAAPATERSPNGVGSGATRGSPSDIVRPRPLDKTQLAPFPEDRLLELIPSPEFQSRPKRVWTGVPGISGPPAPSAPSASSSPAMAGTLSSSSSASSSATSSPACGQPAGCSVFGGGASSSSSGGATPGLVADQLLHRPSSGSAARMRRHTTGELPGSVGMSGGCGCGCGCGGSSTSVGVGGALTPASAGAVTPPPLRGGVEARRASDRAAALSDRAAAAVSTSALGALTGGGPHSAAAQLARSWPPATGTEPPAADLHAGAAGAAGAAGEARRKKRVSFKLHDDAGATSAGAFGGGEAGPSWAGENASLAHTL